MGIDKRAILIEYRGDNTNLVSGHIYTRHDIAHAFGISATTVSNKLDGKNIITDSDLTLTKPKKYSRKSQPIKKMTFMGENTNLFKTGKKYTCKEISQLSGIHTKSLFNRIGSGTVFNEHHVRPITGKKLKDNKPVVQSQFENYPQMVSAQWLRRKF